MDAALSELAEAAGLEPYYWDIEGRRHDTSPETARSLLAALGLPADDEAAVRASLDAVAEERRREVLPPVVIGYEGSPVDVAVRLQFGAGEDTRWVVELETGGTVEGKLAFASLPFIERTETHEARRLTLPTLGLGYHRLSLPGFAEPTCTVVIAPRRCYLPEHLRGGRDWGIVASLYTVRSESDWGIGDFSDLGTVMDWIGGAGAGILGVDPLHTPFLDRPEFASPYAPCSRLHLNPLYLDVTAVPDFAASPEAQAEVGSPAFREARRAARDRALVDYTAVASMKLSVLRTLHAHFRRSEAAADRRAEFDEFVERSGDGLRQLALFQALSEHFAPRDWMNWPTSFRDPASPDVEEFAQTHQEQVDFFVYLQWLCTEQLAQAVERGRDRGMRIGLYRDLAVGIAVQGADHWADQRLFAGGARIGAPPDPFNESGQEWGVVPLNPRVLRASRYAHFIAMLRANMRCAGALRIDHIMGWRRLFVIPAGCPPRDGTYLRFPLDELLAIVALESQRHRCMVIGEDLGTVPEGLPERLAETSILSCRVLYFERQGDRFSNPREYPELATAAATTHDLATLRGFWSAEDLDAKARVGIFLSPEEEQAARAERARDVEGLARALAEEGLLPQSWGEGSRAWTPELTYAAHMFLARSRSHLLLLRLDDLELELEQPNLPGTTDQYPNWRGRLERSIAQLTGDDGLAASLRAVARERQG